MVSKRFFHNNRPCSFRKRFKKVSGEKGRGRMPLEFFENHDCKDLERLRLGEGSKFMGDFL